MGQGRGNSNEGNNDEQQTRVKIAAYVREGRWFLMSDGELLTEEQLVELHKWASNMPSPYGRYVLDLIATIRDLEKDADYWLSEYENLRSSL